MELNKKKTSQKGYSLIELIVVVGLTSILAIAITAIMMSSLLSSSRVRTLIKIRQAGDLAMTQVQQLIRNAKSIDECSSGNGASTDDYIIITGQDGELTTLETEEISPGEYKIASTSALRIRYLNTEDIPAQAFNLTCEPSDTETTLVKIFFTLANEAASGRPFDSPTVNFETSIELRNQ